MATYKSTSPYFTTEKFGNYLDVMKKRNIPRRKDDIIYEIQQVYQYRPDMLAFDLYGSSELWWVFVARNPNQLRDPVWDFEVGTKIYIPQQSAINESLGI